MQTMTSKDGSRIAYDRYGSGPAAILVGGAASEALPNAELRELEGVSHDVKMSVRAPVLAESFR